MNLALLALMLAVVLSDDLNADELNLIGNFLAGVSALIIIIATQKQFRNVKADQTQAKETKAKMEQMQKQIEQLLKKCG